VRQNVEIILDVMIEMWEILDWNEMQETQERNNSINSIFLRPKKIETRRHA
jgi:hypothetical protein